MKSTSLKTPKGFLRYVAPKIKAEYSASNTEYVRLIRRLYKMLKNVHNKKFTNVAQAKRATSLSGLGGYSSPKTSKGEKLGYLTYILYLAAAKMSGFQLCPFATKGCEDACLVGAGHANIIEEGKKLSTVTEARLMRTWLFKFNKEYFCDWLNAEIKSGIRKAKKLGMKFCVRFNGTSDFPLTALTVGGQYFPDIYPKVTFYDYTKVPKQAQLASKWDNYDVTFSFANDTELATGAKFNNIAASHEAISVNGTKLAVVFDLSTFPNGQFPTKFWGFPVVNGDEHDLTFTHPDQTVLGLNLKKTGTDQTGNRFIVTKRIYDELNEGFSTK